MYNFVVRDQNSQILRPLRYLFPVKKILKLYEITKLHKEQHIQLMWHKTQKKYHFLFLDQAYPNEPKWRYGSQ